MKTKTGSTYNFRDHAPKMHSTSGTLTAKKRNAIPSKEFGMPGERKYPMPDRAHQINAKARATQMVKKGKLSPSTASKIKAKANRLLGKS